MNACMKRVKSCRLNHPIKDDLWNTTSIHSHSDQHVHMWTGGFRPHPIRSVCMVYWVLDSVSSSTYYVCDYTEAWHHMCMAAILITSRVFEHDCSHERNIFTTSEAMEFGEINVWRAPSIFQDIQCLNHSSIPHNLRPLLNTH
jgi:hypothetical protein